MKTKLAILLIVGLNICTLVGLAEDKDKDKNKNADTPAKDNDKPEEGVIKYKKTPLNDVISNLALLADINIVGYDPKIPYSLAAADGKTNAWPLVTTRLVGVNEGDALDEILANHNLQLVRGEKNTNIFRVSMKDPAALEPLVTKIIQLKNSGTTNMVTAILSLFATPTRSKVVPDVRTSQLVVVATKKEMESIDEIVARLDTATKQVLIEARILETSKAPSSTKGIDWSGTLDNQSFSFGNGSQSGTATTTTPGATTSSTSVLPGGRTVTSTSTTPSVNSSASTTLTGNGGFNFNTLRGMNPAIGFLNADGVKGALSFFNKDQDTEVIATPRMVLLDNTTGDLSITRVFPIFKITPGSANSPAGSEISYTNLGTILRVTPRITANNMINLSVTPEVSNIDGQDQQVLNGQVNRANIYAVRRINTQVMIPSGNTLVMGGLISDTTSKSWSKIPLLGDIPGPAGNLFRRDSRNRTKTNLIIFVTPTVVEEWDFQASSTDFLRSTADRPEVKESAWDTGRPKDWSTPGSKSKQ